MRFYFVWGQTLVRIVSPTYISPKLSHVTIFHEVFNKRNVKRRSQKTVLWLCPTKHHIFNIMVTQGSFNVHCCKSGVFFQGYTGITQDLMSFQYNYKVFYSVIRKITSQITSFWCKLNRFLQMRVRPLRLNTVRRKFRNYFMHFRLQQISHWARFCEIACIQ